MSGKAIGESIARRYRIIEKLGSGGMGTVYKALDTRLQRLVALKVLHFAHFADGHQGKALFLREAAALARLNHPNIVQTYDVGYTETTVYIVFEYIEGRTLEQILAGTKPLDPDYAIEIIHQVGMALSSAHQRGVIHRDLKPSNILISHDGRVLLLDFGLATAPRASTLTQTGTIAGTPAYMSPEQAMGKLVDGRSDIFSLGVVLYELLTGTRPFEGSLTAEIFRKLCEEAPTTPLEINPSIPSSLAAVVLKCLAKQPEQRFQTVDEFRSALIEANPRQAFSLSRRRSPEREGEYFSDVFGDFFEETVTPAGTPMEQTPSAQGTRRFGLEVGEEAGQSLALTRERIGQIEARTLRKLRHPPGVLLAVGRRLRSRVLAVALAISILLLLGFVLFGVRRFSSSSTTRGSWFSDYGLGLTAVAVVGLIVGFVWRIYAARTGPSHAKVVPSPTESADVLAMGAPMQTGRAKQMSLEEMETILQGGVGDRDATASGLLPYRPPPRTQREQLIQYPPEVLAEANRLGVSPGILAEAKRLQEFNAIWDQLTSSARHA